MIKNQLQFKEFLDVISFIFSTILFSSWHTLIRVIPKISPISCNVMGPPSADISVQFKPRSFSIQYLHDIIEHVELHSLFLSKHFIFTSRWYRILR